MHKSKILAILAIIILLSLAGAFSLWRSPELAAEPEKTDSLTPPSEAKGSRQDVAAALCDIEKNIDNSFEAACAPPKPTEVQTKSESHLDTHPETEAQAKIKFFRAWDHFEKAILAQKDFKARIEVLHFGLKSLQQRRDQISKKHIDLKMNADLMISSLMIFPEVGAQQKDCADYLRKVFVEFDPTAFKADSFNQSWSQNLPEEPSVRRAYQLMVGVCR